MVLADTAFGSGVSARDTPTIMRLRVCNDRLLVVEAMLETFTQAWSTSTSGRLKLPVSVSWYYFKRENGKRRN